MTTTNYTVTGMTCEHCERAIAQEVGEVQGVESVRVDRATGSLSVESSAPVDDQAVIDAVDEAGYEARRA